jgi:hypothetical protein
LQLDHFHLLFSSRFFSSLIGALPNKWLLAVRPDWIGLIPACDRVETRKLQKTAKMVATGELDELSYGEESIKRQQDRKESFGCKVARWIPLPGKQQKQTTSSSS